MLDFCPKKPRRINPSKVAFAREKEVIDIVNYLTIV